MLLLTSPGVVAKYVYYENGEEPGADDVKRSGKSAYRSRPRYNRTNDRRNA
jgi:hypothetical protein